MNQIHVFHKRILGEVSAISAIQITICYNFPCNACTLNQSAQISIHELLTECIANVCEKSCDSCCILRDDIVNKEMLTFRFSNKKNFFNFK